MNWPVAGDRLTTEPLHLKSESLLTLILDTMSGFLASLGLRYPLIQAPIAGIATPALCAAVSNAGALGSIGIGATDSSGARAMIHEVRKRTNRPFNVNVFTHATPHRNPGMEKAWLALLTDHFAATGSESPKQLQVIYASFLDDQAKVEMLIQEKIPFISFHFGLPSKAVIKALKEAGSILICTVTNMEEARKAEEGGMDILLAQGHEAGGHRGVFDLSRTDEQLSTFDLTRRLLDATKLPVIAAGGIMDGRRIAEVIHLGAAGAQLGTAFLLCPETRLDGAYQEALKSIRSTQMTSFVSGRPARSLTSHFTRLENANPTMTPPDFPLSYSIGKALHAAPRKNGDHGYGAFWAGQGVQACREMPAKELVETLMREMERCQQKQGQ